MHSPPPEFLYPGSKLGTKTNFCSQIVWSGGPPHPRGGRFNYFLAKIPIFQRFSKTCGRKHIIVRYKSWTLDGHHFRWSFKNINKIFLKNKNLFSEVEITYWELRSPKSGFAPNFFFWQKHSKLTAMWLQEKYPKIGVTFFFIIE